MLLYTRISSPYQRFIQLFLSNSVTRSLQIFLPLLSAMADHHKEEEKKDESFLDKIADKIRGHDSPSDSEGEKTSSLKANVYRLFGREKPVHRVLGGGKRTFNKIRGTLIIIFSF